MPDLTTATLVSLDGMSPEQLHQRRRNIVQRYLPNPDADPTTKLADMTIEDLHELAAITTFLRHTTISAPSTKKKAKAASKAGSKMKLQDLLGELGGL